jgi:hypothetical protein
MTPRRCEGAPAKSAHRDNITNQEDLKLPAGRRESSVLAFLRRPSRSTFMNAFPHFRPKRFPQQNNQPNYE